MKGELERGGSGREEVVLAVVEFSLEGATSVNDLSILR